MVNEEYIAFLEDIEKSLAPIIETDKALDATKLTQFRKKIQLKNQRRDLIDETNVKIQLFNDKKIAPHMMILPKKAETGQLHDILQMVVDTKNRLKPAEQK